MIVIAILSLFLAVAASVAYATECVAHSRTIRILEDTLDRWSQSDEEWIQIAERMGRK